MKFMKSGILSAAVGILILAGGCASDAALKETVWTPVKLENQGTVGLVQDQPVWFSVGSDNKVIGTAAVAEDGKLVFEPLATTRKAGPNLAYEAIFLNALNATRTYQIKEETLQVFDKGGNLLATFTVGPESLTKEKE
mgnify:CR=1 FL=1